MSSKRPNSASPRPSSSRASANSGARSRKPAPKAPKRSQGPKRHWLRNILITAVVLICLGILGFALLIARTTVPTPNELATSEATIVYWADGVHEIGRLGDATRRSVSLEDVPLDVQHAVLAAEDREFYQHGGVSPIGIGRAIVNNITGGSTQGGSTITQQYAKNAFLTQERSFTRKAKEALLAFKLETSVGKDEILGNYLNTIYFGRGAYGIDAASIAYFGKPVQDLTFSEGAVLASIIKSPSGLAPESNLSGLRARWEYVLDSMVEQAWLTQKQRKQAEFPEIKKQKAKDRLGGQTGFLLTMVEQALQQQGFDEQEIQGGGLRIYSTFDRAAQRAATAAVKKAGPTSGTEGLRIGLAAVRPGTGEVVAVYGGRDFVQDQINNATTPFAQAGSTFKPFALAAATGQKVPLSSVWNGNSPATVNGYTFSNYGDKSYGEVTLLKATENSINSAYVELESSIGVDSVAAAAVSAGIPEDTPGMNLDNLDLTFVLGTASPSGLQMANAYATFAASGQRSVTSVLKKVVGPGGGLLYEFTPTTTMGFYPEDANTVTYALSRVVTNGTAAVAQGLGRPAAAKTGTTDDNKSAWFVGYTPQLSAAVLMAKEDAKGKPVSMAGTGGLATVTGGSFPAAIWTAFMKAALDGTEVVDFPAPPEDVYRPPTCPTEMPADGAVPPGCPTPTEYPEFEPVPTATLAPEVSPLPSVESSQSPDPGVFTPDATVPAQTPPPPVQEGRPQ